MLLFSFQQGNLILIMKHFELNQKHICRPEGLIASVWCYDMDISNQSYNTRLVPGSWSNKV